MSTPRSARGLQITSSDDVLVFEAGKGRDPLCVRIGRFRDDRLNVQFRLHRRREDGGLVPLSVGMTCSVSEWGYLKEAVDDKLRDLGAL